MAENVNIAARFFKDLGNPVRLKILLILLKGEKCLCEILPQFKIAQPTMSRHLSVLKEHNLISFRRESNKIIYSIKDKKVIEILKAYGLKPQFLDKKSS
jgi:ArsR family transcriptional regulator